MSQVQTAAMGARKETLSWKAGKPLVYNAEKTAEFDARLMVEVDPERLRASACCLMIRVEPHAVRFIDGPLDVVEVRSFRYVLPDGGRRHWLLCGTCGHVMICAESELQQVAAMCCRDCSAGPTEHRCGRWHNWGECDRCAGFPGSEPLAAPRGGMLAQIAADSAGGRPVARAGGG